MPTNNTNDVELDVRNSTTDGDGWINVTGSNNQPYSYKYTGGDAHTNYGHVTFSINGGQGVINLSVVAADARYQLVGQNCITFTGDKHAQLSTHGNAPRSRVIHDSCTAALDGQYKVLVTDTTANATVACDPRVVNTGIGI